MARIRTIKPGFFKHEELSELDAETQLLAAGLLCYADDEGFFNANPGLIKGEIFPLRTLGRPINEMLSDLERSKYIRLGHGSDGRTYGHIINFLDHQVISHPKESLISGLQISWNDHGILPERSLPEVEVEVELNKETGKGNRKGASALAIPDWIPQETWNDFAEMRKKLRKPLTTKAAELIIAKLDRLRAVGHSPADVLNQSIEMGWQGVFELKSKGFGNVAASNKPSILEQIRRAREANV